ncbi:hypothetical protein F5H01DRAFT_18496 [Linnemannia elongata]|nr:hypothetical protein F5H01DRAFT_18496 [Linnemannia elongata]
MQVMLSRVSNSFFLFKFFPLFLSSQTTTCSGTQTDRDRDRDRDRDKDNPFGVVCSKKTTCQAPFFTFKQRVCMVRVSVSNFFFFFTPFFNSPPDHSQPK